MKDKFGVTKEQFEDFKELYKVGDKIKIPNNLENSEKQYGKIFKDYKNKSFEIKRIFWGNYWSFIEIEPIVIGCQIQLILRDILNSLDNKEEDTKSNQYLLCKK